MRTTAVAFVFVFAVLVGGCGSGGSSGPSSFLAAPNVAPMSGTIYGPAATPTVIPSGGAVIWVGDRPSNEPEFGYYRFDISAIPPGASIEEAFFRVGQESIVGGPYAALGGQVVVDHVELGAALDPADYAPTTYANSIAVLSTSPALGQRSADVRSAVQADVNNGRTHTDLRLRFPLASDGDGLYDDASFNNSANTGGSSLRPLLEIRYR